MKSASLISTLLLSLGLIASGCGAKETSTVTTAPPVAGATDTNSMSHMSPEAQAAKAAAGGH